MWETPKAICSVNKSMPIIERSGKDTTVISEITVWSGVMIGMWDDLQSYPFMMPGMENSLTESSLKI